MQSFSTTAALPKLPCACATVRRSSRALTQIYASRLQGHGMEGTQFTLLQVLQHTGEITQRQLGELLVIDSTTLSRSLAPLQRQGWIAVRPGKDRREKRISLTPAGQTQLSSAMKAWNDVQSRLKKVLGEKGWAQTMQALETLTAAALQLDQDAAAGEAR